MRKMHWVVVKGHTLIILSPYHEENALGGSKGTHPDNTEPILSKTCVGGGGVVKGPTLITLNPYYDNTEPIL